MRRRSTWFFPDATAPPAAGFRCIPRTHAPSGSSSVRRIPSCNPYLAFTAMLMAGLDGIDRRIDPGQPIDKNLYDLPPEEAKGVKSTPGSLEQALDALEADHAFLLRGDVFTEDSIETWLELQADKGDRCHPAAPTSLRVPSLLRHLVATVPAKARNGAAKSYRL